jgi:ABC-type multidrug transport system fused ATPase/permease subunit
MISKEIINLYLPTIKRHKNIFVLMIVGAVISWFSGIAIPLLLKYETDQLANNGSSLFPQINSSPFFIFVLILFVLLIVKFIDQVVDGIIRVITEKKKEIIENELQIALFTHMQEVEVGRTLNSRFHYLRENIESAFFDIWSKILQEPKNILTTIISSIGIITVLTYFDITLLVVIVITTIIQHFINTFSENYRRKHEISWKMWLGRKLHYYQKLFLRNFGEMAANGAMQKTLHEYKEILDHHRKHKQKWEYIEIIANILGFLSSSVGEVTIKCIVGYAVFQGTQSIGMVALVTWYSERVWRILSDILGIKIKYRDTKFQLSTLHLFVKMFIPIGHYQNSKTLSIVKVEFRDVCFKYPMMQEYEREYLNIVEQYFWSIPEYENTWYKENIQKFITDAHALPEEQTILKNVSICFEKWKIYGIVGKNGAGKTTMMHLLAWFYRSYTGIISINNQDTKDWKTTYYSEQISFLSQVPFSLQWWANIRQEILFWVTKNVTDETIYKLLEEFGLKKKIEKLPAWLDSMLGDDIEFSGGEKQIIAFIRLLLQDRPIVIMDEGTNQLDAENEILVMNKLLEKKSEKIIIFITHRMSTISRADEIYCLEHHSITHHGTHTELLAEGKNAYARFYTAQVLHHTGK